MYVINKSESIKESLMVRNASGQELVVDVEIKVTPQVVQDFRRAQVQLIELQKRDKKDTVVIEKIGTLVVDIFLLFFGKTDTEKLIEFYDGDYATMMIDVFPFLADEVIPKLSIEAKKRKKQLKQKYL